jgi:hypothetical protein
MRKPQAATKQFHHLLYDFARHDFAIITRPCPHKTGRNCVQPVDLRSDSGKIIGGKIMKTGSRS